MSALRHDPARTGRRSSSRRDDWATPQWLFDALHAEFGFTLDAAATAANAKCPRFFDPAADGLAQSWAGEVVWLNPPYSQAAAWVEKAAREAAAGATVVMLLPASTGTRWFHSHIYGRAELRLLPGRLRFEGAPHPAPFDSMIVIYRPSIASLVTEPSAATIGSEHHDDSRIPSAKPVHLIKLELGRARGVGAPAGRRAEPTGCARHLRQV